MCGRFALIQPTDIVRAAFGFDEEPCFPPRFNIAPTQPIGVVIGERTAHGPARRFELLRWGFVPSFVKDFSSFKPIFNARSEGLTEKPSFRHAFQRRRCLVMADGYYVWQAYEGGARPWLVRRARRRPFGLAGLKEHWLGADGSEIDTGCIVTAAAEGLFAVMHPRRPVIVAPEDCDLWLDPDETRTGEAVPLLGRPPSRAFEAVPIGTAVNRVANDFPDIQTPTGPALPLAIAIQTRWTGGQGELF